MKYGYASTSTDDQTTALQTAALKRAKCAHTFEDKGQSGATAKRSSLLRCLKTLRAGDTLVVWKLNRLGVVRGYAAAAKSCSRISKAYCSAETPSP